MNQGKRFILIFGGVRSGKSTLAVETAQRLGGERVAFIATCVPDDEEMRRRVVRHRASRPAAWALIEEGRNPAAAVRAAAERHAVVVVDCLGLWLSNRMVEEEDDAVLESEIDEFVAAAAAAPVTVIVVSNEVGCGLVPCYPAGRRFRDLLGLTNQRAARRADEVYFLQAGLPQRLK